MSKLVYISSSAAPHQIKLCQALNKYISSEFWFYEQLSSIRASWWKIPLCSKCKILDNLLISKNNKYLTFDVIKRLNNTNPDIVMIGGFSIPSNYLAYRWAKKNNKKTIIFTEMSRDRQGNIRKYNFIWKIIHFLYRKVDYIFTSNENATEQFKYDFKFGDKVVTTRYASDLDDQLNHPYRVKKDAYVYLFANRLTEIYNPLLAIDIFFDIQKQYPMSKLLINNEGELKKQCVARVDQLKIQDKVEFLTEIKQYDDLSKIYARADILLFPAIFSNGNFSINESMASGMGIVISNKINGHSDTLTNRKNCFIVEPERESFLTAINNYINDSDLFEKHAIINKELMQPLSIDGTAKFLYEKLIILKLVK